jgi:hypothetical protein
LRLRKLIKLQIEIDRKRQSRYDVPEPPMCCEAGPVIGFTGHPISISIKWGVVVGKVGEKWA